MRLGFPVLCPRLLRSLWAMGWVAVAVFVPRAWGAPPPNTPPVISAIPDQKIVEGGTTAALPFTVGDAETAVTSLVVYPLVSNPFLVGATNMFFGGSGASRTIQLAATPKVTGVCRVTLVVRDPDGATNASPFLLTVVNASAPNVLVDPRSRAVAVGEDVVFTAVPSGAGPLSYQWLWNGGEVAGATSPTLTLHKVQPFQAGGYSLRVSNPLGTYTSAVATLTVSPVPRGASWRYADTGVDQGSGWRLPGFDDSTWAAGPAPLGYGHGDEATVVSYGGDPQKKQGTTYFRRGFVVDRAAAYTSLLVRLRREDGAVVYLNGLEVTRQNLPAGEIGYNTHALVDVQGPDQSKYFEAAADPRWLQDGLNVLAVELHLAAASSPELGFDLQLDGNALDLPRILSQPVSQLVSPTTLNVPLSVTASSSRPLSYQWQLNGMNIPGATDPTLVVATPREQGGTYRAVVITAQGSEVSDPATLTVGFPEVVASDTFAGAPLLGDPAASGAVRGTSEAASREAGEPRHGNRDGGRSVWYRWRAPATGIATLSTRGSTFDTVLAVYQGSGLNSLSLVGEDDDGDAYYTSAVRFSVVAGEEYRVAIDGVGMGGAGGPFVLRWDVEPTQERVPRILVHPAHTGVVQGAAAVFTVVAEGGNPGELAYQWFFEGSPIPGATSSSLVIPDAQVSHVGYYSVQVHLPNQRPITSRPAALEIGSVPGADVRDKIEDLFTTPPAGVPPLIHPASVGAASAPTASGAVAFSLGSQYYKFAPRGNNSLTDPLPCASYFNGTLWLLINAQDRMVLEIDTENSRDTEGHERLTQLAVYRVSPGFERAGAQYLVGCDAGSFAAGRQSRVLVEAAAGEVYAVVAAPAPCPAGVACGTPVLSINVRARPAYYFLPRGTPFSLSLAPRTWTPSPAYAWRRNGTALPGTASRIELVADCDTAGSYTVSVSNGLQSQVLPVAMVFVDEPFHLYPELVPHDQRTDLRITVFGSMPFSLEASDALADGWTPIARHTVPRLPMVYVLPGVDRGSTGFYRAVCPDCVPSSVPVLTPLPCVAPTLP